MNCDVRRIHKAIPTHERPKGFYKNVNVVIKRENDVYSTFGVCTLHVRAVDCRPQWIRSPTKTALSVKWSYFIWSFSCTGTWTYIR